MPIIISEERFKSQYNQILERYILLKEKFPKDVKFKKLNRVIRQMKSAYSRDKIYSVKYLNHFEMVQVSFSEERRALIVKCVELMQKVILHKKLNGDDS